jgi:ADP-ribosylglycohydrolase
MDRLDEVLGGMSPVHTINNALICCLSLLYGRMDTTLAITTSVMCGHDTDCNGATVGSIVGAARGRRDFGGELAPRLNDTIRASMIGFQNITLSELAERTLIEFDRVNEYFKRRAS